MPVKVNGQTYYRTTEVCRMVGISRTTLFRWLKEGVSTEAEHRDRRGWRLFTADEIDRLKTEVNRTIRMAKLELQKSQAEQGLILGVDK